ncbi:MAG: livF [Acidimicrobiia bacterium]|nr:livF [Acidimicrobiia bacterium]
MTAAISGHPRLRCSEVSAGYENLAVARSLNLSVGRNEILAILGPNGAGKTTLLLTIAGLLAPIDGEIEVDGVRLRPGAPRQANRAGVVLVPDSRALFTELSTTENLKLAARRPGAVAEAMDLFPGLQRRAKVKAGMLSGGEQQMLAVARALVQSPKVLLIDEMSMGLAPVIVESLMPIVRRVADETDAAVVLVEQHVHLALEIADQALVMVHGEIRLTGPAQQLRDNVGQLEAAYLSR